MTPAAARQFVQRHGIVLASAKGRVPNLADAIAGETIRGSWWGHREGKRIFALLGALEEDAGVLVCRLVDDKKTYVHQRLWPALVRCAAHFPATRLARTHERHTAGGTHVREDIAFPDWVPPEVMRAANALDEATARRALSDAGVAFAEEKSTR